MSSHSSKNSITKLLHRLDPSRPAKSQRAPAPDSSPPAPVVYRPNEARRERDYLQNSSGVTRDIANLAISDPPHAHHQVRHKTDDSQLRGHYAAGEGEALRVYNDGTVPRSIPIGTAIGSSRDPYAEDIADWNMRRDEAILAGDLNDSHAVRMALEKDRRIDPGPPPQRRSHDQNRRGSVQKKRVGSAGGASGSNNRPMTAPASRYHDAWKYQENEQSLPVRERRSMQRHSVPPEDEQPVANTRSTQEHAVRVGHQQPFAHIAHNQDNSSRGSTSSTLRGPKSTQRQASQVEDEQQSTYLTPHSQDMAAEDSATSSLRESADLASQYTEYGIFNSSEPIDNDLAKVVDLSNTVHTTVHTKQAPAVTHETRIVDTHAVRHEHITREIHTHDVHHRILPVHDIHVLPPRHFIPTGPSGQLAEIPAPSVEKDAHLQSVMQQAADFHLQAALPGSGGPRRFTARVFEGEEGDYKTATDERDGSGYSHHTWVHPVSLERGGRESGQTVPFHIHWDR